MIAHRKFLLPLAALAAALQIGFLAWTIAGRAAILRDGTEILLRVEPVDPRDLLRGDYVRLGYDGVTTIDPSQPGGPVVAGAFESGDAVDCLLEKGEDGFWRVKSVQPAGMATAGDGQAVLRGTTESTFAEGQILRVAYGIERFYLPEGEGREIERDLGTRSFSMKVAVSKGGTAQIKAFFDGETLLYAEPLY